MESRLPGAKNATGKRDDGSLTIEDERTSYKDERKLSSSEREMNEEQLRRALVRDVGNVNSWLRRSPSQSRTPSPSASLANSKAEADPRPRSGSAEAKKAAEKNSGSSQGTTTRSSFQYNPKRSGSRVFFQKAWDSSGKKTKPRQGIFAPTQSSQAKSVRANLPKP